jgi:hypothetical protein
MSLANVWADGKDSIAAPRSLRRSAERDVDAKDQFHPGSRKKGRRSRYDDAKNIDMVAAGYVHEDPDDSRDLPRRGNNYHGSSSRSNSRDSKPSKEWRRRQPQLSAEEMLDNGCPRHTYLDKDGVRRPAHLLIECREFLRLSRALQERMIAEQPVAGAGA